MTPWVLWQEVHQDCPAVDDYGGADHGDDADADGGGGDDADFDDGDDGGQVLRPAVHQGCPARVCCCGRPY